MVEEVKLERKARSTGTVVQLIKNPGAESEMPWMTLCVDHGGCVCHDTRKLAEGWLSQPQDWCPTCQEKRDEKETRDGNDQVPASVVTDEMNRTNY
jgi:hypothetical protein